MSERGWTAGSAEDKVAALASAFRLTQAAHLAIFEALCSTAAQAGATGRSPAETQLVDLARRHLAEERGVVLAALDATGGNLRLAAAALGVRYSTLQRVLRRHDGLAEDAQELRRASGYRGGRPKRTG